MEGGAAAGNSSCGGSTAGKFTVNRLTQQDYKQVVESTKPFLGSVVRIIRVSKKKDVTETGTAFLVFRGEKRSLFLTCDHKFMKRKMGEVIRFSNEDKRDYPVDKIHYRDGARDLLLFSVKGDVPENPCVEFSTDKVQQHDKVSLVGYCTTTIIPDENGVLVQALVKVPGLYTGKISADAFRREDIQEYYEKIIYNFAVAGDEGSPLFGNGEVIGVHLANQGRWKDGVSSRTVLQVLREWLGVGEDDQATVEELFQMVYDKIEPNVPNVELSTERKKQRMQ